MVPDISQDKWLQIGGAVEHWWGELIDDDLDRIEGRMEVLAGVLRERFGHSREAAENEIARFLNEN